MGARSSIAWRSPALQAVSSCVMFGAVESMARSKQAISNKGYHNRASTRSAAFALFGRNDALLHESSVTMSHAEKKQEEEMNRKHLLASVAVSVLGALAFLNFGADPVEAQNVNS